MPKKPKKPTKTIRINDINIKGGDFVANDKNVVYGEDNNNSDSETQHKNERAQKGKSRELGENLEIGGGDFVVGNKVIKFFQENLNIYFFKDVKQLAFFLIFLIIILGSIAGSYWYSKQPKKMTGSYNIAIAQFGEIQANGVNSSSTAEKISSTLFNFLDSEYRASGLGLTVQVEHENIPLINEDSQAEKLAKQINANIVIYGNVSIQGNH